MIQITAEQYAQYQELLAASGSPQTHARIMTKLEREIDKVQNNPNLSEEKKLLIISNLNDANRRALEAEKKKLRNKQISSLKERLSKCNQLIESYQDIVNDCSMMSVIQQFEFLVFDTYKISLSRFETVKSGFDTREYDGLIYFYFGDLYFVERDEIEKTVSSCLATLNTEMETAIVQRTTLQQELDALFALN